VTIYAQKKAMYYKMQCPALRTATASFFLNLINYRHYERNEVISYFKRDCHSLQKSKLRNDNIKKDIADSLLKRTKIEKGDCHVILPRNCKG